MAKNLFASAKEKAPAKKAAKDDKILVNVSGSEFAEKLAQFATLKSQLDEIKAELELSQGFVKATGIEEYATLVEKNKSNVGSFLLGSDKGGSVMVLPTKKYITIDEDRANTLKETYGEDVVDENTTFGFSTEILMKNQEVISELIQNCDSISQEDKDNLIVAKTIYKVKDDTLDKVFLLSKESGRSVIEVIEDIKPVVMLKNPKSSK